MKYAKFISKFLRETEGTVAVTTAICLIVAVGSMAVAIDLGHLYLVKTELQRAADAGAMAGARGLLAIPPGAAGPVAISQDCGRALAVTQRVAPANKTDGDTLTLLDSDVTFGRWDSASKSFEPIGCSNPKLVDAVKVVTRKDSSANSPVLFDFAGALPGGKSSQDVTAQAVGLISYVGHAPPGAKVFPLAVDADKVPPNNTPFRIHLNPTPGDEGCWHAYKDSSSGTSDTRAYIDYSLPSPELKVGDLINVKEGVADAALQEVARQYEQITRQGNTYDVLIPIIPANSSHSNWQPVEGFGTLRITDVRPQGSDKYVEGFIVPDYVAPGVNPGGPNFGTLAGIPKMAL